SLAAFSTFCSTSSAARSSSTLRRSNRAVRSTILMDGLLQRLNESPHFFALRLVSGPIDEEPRRAFSDHFQHFESVFFQGAAGFDQIDNSVGQADQRRQFDRSGERDDLHRNSVSVVIIH